MKQVNPKYTWREWMIVPAYEEAEEGNYSKLKELQTNLDEINVRKTDLRRKGSIYNTAQILLKDTGIKSRIIKQYVPVINKLINKYLASMDFFVNFRLDNEFKDHKFSVSGLQDFTSFQIKFVFTGTNSCLPARI